MCNFSILHDWSKFLDISLAHKVMFRKRLQFWPKSQSSPCIWERKLRCQSPTTPTTQTIPTYWMCLAAVVWSNTKSNASDNYNDSTDYNDSNRLDKSRFFFWYWCVSVIIFFPQKCCVQNTDLFIGPRCPWGPIYGSGSLKLSKGRFADLTDVTLANEDNNSVPTVDDPGY